MISHFSFIRTSLRAITFFESLTSRHIASYSNKYEENLFKYTPKYVHKYITLTRFNKAIGSWLLFLPCAWSISIAPYENFVFDPSKMLIFGAGSVLMRSAACIINDMWDHDLDSKVERTKSRPIASGEISLSKALVFLNFNLALCFVLLMQLNLKCISLGMFSVLPVIFYPLCKRLTNWPQLFLAFTINIGALMGYPAVTNSWGIYQTLPLYISSICWTMIYDTIYAHQDIKDDVKIGIKSTAITFSGHTYKWLSVFYIGMLSNLLISGYIAGLNEGFYLASTCALLFYFYAIKKTNLSSAESCSKFFITNRNVGLSILGSICLGKIAI